MTDALKKAQQRRTSKVEHTVASIISATGHSKKKIEEALKKGWFGPVIVEKREDDTYYKMGTDAVANYLEGGYEKRVYTSRTPRKGSKSDRRLHYYPYKYTQADAERDATKQADEFMSDKENLRLEKLNHPNRTDEQIRERKYEAFKRDLLSKKRKVVRKRLPEAEGRILLELPKNFAALILDKLLPEDAVYAIEKLYEYTDLVGEARWGQPNVRMLVMMIIREELEIHRLHDLKLLEPDGVQDDIDDSLSKTMIRWTKANKELGLISKETKPVKNLGFNMGE